MNPKTKMQKKQYEWEWQWNNARNDSKWLFTEWIYPNNLEDFRGKEVLDCGCGGGQHLNLIAPYCKAAVGVDLNSGSIARRNNRHNRNIKIMEGDIAKINLGKKFDTVYSIGVLHHTDNPTASFNNIAKHAKKRGKVIVWVYSFEGNLLNRVFLESFKKIFFFWINKKILWIFSNFITGALYVPIFTVYLLPLRFLPFYEYFQNFRKLSFKENNLNVFDKLNAPQTFFIKKSVVGMWFNPKKFRDVHISPYRGVSWRASGTKK